MTCTDSVEIDWVWEGVGVQKELVISLARVGLGVSLHYAFDSSWWLIALLHVLFMITVLHAIPLPVALNGIWPFWFSLLSSILFDVENWWDVWALPSHDIEMTRLNCLLERLNGLRLQLFGRSCLCTAAREWPRILASRSCAEGRCDCLLFDTRRGLAAQYHPPLYPRLRCWNLDVWDRRCYRRMLYWTLWWFHDSSLRSGRALGLFHRRSRVFPFFL